MVPLYTNQKAKKKPIKKTIRKKTFRKICIAIKKCIAITTNV